MNKTKIEWCDYTLNPVKGLCPMACPYCYARAMYKRFKWNPEIRFEADVLWDNVPRSKPAKIFMGSTIELFGDWIKPEWLEAIFQFARIYDDLHTFIFLTKQPQNLIKFSPFPENCYVGVSATNQQQLDNAVKYLKEVEATVKFISFEPLLERINLD